MAGKLQLNRCCRLMSIALMLLLGTPGDGSDKFTNEGPRFSIEPNGLIEFSNSTGFHVNCSATGNPKPRITWMFSDGSAVSNISGLRQIEADGTLVFLPFRAQDFRQDVHAVVYRCLAFNSQGSIISRDVQVKAAVAQTYDVYVYDTYVIKGNTGVLKCHVPGFLVKYVKVVSWIRDQISMNVNTDLRSDEKYVMDPEGNLYIRNIQVEDGRSTYQCKTNHRLTNVTRVSVTMGKLFVTEPETNVPVRFVESKAEIIVNVDETAIIPCIAQGFPVPKTIWLKKTNNGQIEKIENHGRTQYSSDALIISEVKSNDAGVYICESSNGIGSERMETRLLINAPLTAKIVPSRVIIETGESIELNCETQSVSNLQIIWLKDSKQLTSKNILNNGQRLVITNSQSSDRGMYQCIVKTDLLTVHGVAEIMMGDLPPELIFTFEEKQLPPESSLSLLCKATGNPLPTITWTLDNIKYNGDVLSSTVDNKVVSWLNISKVRKEDGGVYGCSASNSAGMTSHYDRIGVYGSLMSRPMQKVTSIAGEDVSMHCPVYGYPLDSITWEKDGELLPFNFRQVIKKTGSLSITKTQKLSDKGLYICHAKNSNNVVQAAVELILLVPPKITPFSFQEDLVREGMRARIQCVVSEGDLPLTIQWTLDGYSIPIDLGITIRDLDEFSSILTISAVTPKHNGNYICTATNNAATVSYSAQLSVNVPPKIIPFLFQDDQFFKGMRAHIICAVSQGDSPIKFEWRKDGQHLSPSLGVLTRNIDGHANSLSIESVSSDHTGNYTCVATNNAATVTHTAQLLVYVSPKISPFSFQDDSTYLGAFARVSCLIYQGDLPITLQWLKDNQAIIDDDVTVRLIDEYSSILTIDNVQTRHTGNYTCVASNAASTVSYTATLVVNVPPKIVPFTFQDDSLFEGMLVRVSCVISRGDLPLKILWLKDGQKIEDRSVTIRDFDDYSSVLSIDPVSTQHNGNYTCIASNHAASVNYTTALIVNVPPKWIIAPEDTTAVINKSVVLNCKAEGFPVPTINWMKTIGEDPTDVKSVKLIEGIEILSNGSIYIAKVNLNHQGYYFCFASNGISGELSRRMQLKVQAPVYFKEKNLLYKFRAGQSGILHCEAYGDSPILFSWFCNETTLDNLPTKHRFTQQTTKDEIKGSIINELHISTVERYDSGHYTCSAENSFGKEKLIIEVIIEDVPAAPEIKTILNKGNKTVDISWNTVFHGNSPIIHYILQYKRKQDSWQGRFLTLTLDPLVLSTSVHGLQAATGYEFRIAAENSIGKSDFSPIVTIVTGEEAPEGSPQQVEVDTTDPQTLRISWKPPKKSHWNGIIRGYLIGYKVYKSNEQYTFISLEVPEDYGDDVIYQLSNLKQFTQYSIIVQAYNNGGRGPSSEEIVIMTSEDVPSEPPRNVRCSSLSSRSVYVLWDPPSPESTNGIIRGYKVFYKLLRDWYNGDVELQITDVARLTLQGLNVDANYSIQVVAFTKMGEGVKSQPIICKTYEDVPEAPEAIKVLPCSTDSVMVAWKGPKKPNGVITKYNVYYKPITDGEELNRDNGNGKGNMNMHSLASDFNFFEVKGLQKNVRYAFWVTATSSIGEGPESQILTQATAGKIVPAKAASFDGTIKTPWKRDVEMSCKAIGQPQPQTRWISRGKTVTENERVLVRFDGSLVIKRIDQEDTGNYTCRIINQYGSDEVHYSVTVIVPPGSPILEILSKSVNSVRLRWRSRSDGGDPIKGYILHYKRDVGQWDKIELTSDTEMHTLEHLSCGATYQLFMEAFNSVGTGVPGDVVTVTTNGDAFNTPQKNKLIKESSTFATINLDSWPSNGCPIAYFVVEYKQQTSKDWILVSDHIQPSQRKLVIPGLVPASWYVLRITVHTSGDDFNIAEYIFSTLTHSGGKMLYENGQKEEKVVLFYLDPYIFIPSVTILIVIIITGVVIFIICKRNNGSRDAPVDWTRTGTLARHNEMGDSVESFIHLQKFAANTMARNATLRRVINDTDPTYATIRSSYQTMNHARRSDPLPANHQVTHLTNVNGAWIPAMSGVSGQLVPVPVRVIPQSNNCVQNEVRQEPLYGIQSIMQPAIVNSRHVTNADEYDVRETTFNNPGLPQQREEGVNISNYPEVGLPPTTNRNDVEGDDWLI